MVGHHHLASRRPIVRESADDRQLGSQGRESESGTLLDLLARSVENAISGTWQSGAHNGGWTVKALPSQ